MGTETGVWLFNKQGLWIQGVVGKEIGVRGKIIQGAWAQRQGFGYLINRGLWIQRHVGKVIGVRGKVIQGAWAQRQGFGYLINGGYGYTCA